MPIQSPSVAVLGKGRIAPKTCVRHAACWLSVSHLVWLSLLGSSLLLLSVLTQAQDSAKQQEPSSKRVSGFLDDYSGLYPDPKNGDLLLYEKDKTALKPYHKFLLEPVTVFLLPEAEDRGIDPDDLDRLARYFADAATDELMGSGYEVVTEPGPGVLYMRLAITNVEPTGGKKNAALKAGATAASMAVAPGASLAVPRLSVGKVEIEGEMLDSLSGERIAAFVTSKGGRRWFSGLNAYKKWGDIEAALRSWAKDFRKRLDQANES
jgi:hypothetical protein